MDTVEVFAASAGIGQVLTEAFEPSAFQSAHEAGPCNRMTVQFKTIGILPDWIDWRVETSVDNGITWRVGPALVLWSGRVTLSKQVSTRPGTSMTAIEIPRGALVRLLARRRGGGHDTAILGLGTFEDVPPKRRRDEAVEVKRPVRRTDPWGRPFETSRAPGGRRPL